MQTGHVSGTSWEPGKEVSERLRAKVEGALTWPANGRRAAYELHCLDGQLVTHAAP